MRSGRDQAKPKVSHGEPTASSAAWVCISSLQVCDNERTISLATTECSRWLMKIRSVSLLWYPSAQHPRSRRARGLRAASWFRFLPKSLHIAWGGGLLEDHAHAR